MYVEHASLERRERVGTDLLHVPGQDHDVSPGNQQGVTNRKIQLPGVGMGGAAQVFPRQPVADRTLDGAGPGVIGNHKDDLGSKRPGFDIVDDGLHIRSAMRGQDADLQRHDPHSPVICQVRMSISCPLATRH